jgi:uncharacterized protein (TIGR02001 family)
MVFDRANRRSWSLALCGVALALSGGNGALAADEGVASPDVSQMFDVAFGAAVTSDYISRGITQTDHGAAIQGYIEPSFGIIYGGVWASNVAFGGVADTEVDAYVGIRPEIGNVTLDLGYSQAFYLLTPTDSSGEFYGKVDVSVTDNVTIGGQFFVNPVTSDTYTEANADVGLPHGFGVSGALGFVSGSTLYTTWNAGIYYSPVEWAKVDLRYTATNLSSTDCGTITELTGNECDARVMVGVSVDTSLSALRGN